MAQTSITGIKPAELFVHLNQYVSADGDTRLPVSFEVGGFTINEFTIESDGKHLTVTGHLPGEQPKAARARK